MDATSFAVCLNNAKRISHSIQIAIMAGRVVSPEQENQCNVNVSLAIVEGVLALSRRLHRACATMLLAA